MNAKTECPNCTKSYPMFKPRCPFCDYNYRPLLLSSIKSKIVCNFCHFENDLANEICVACDASLYQENQQQSKCQFCGTSIPERLFSEHATNCMLSMEAIKEEEEKMKAMEEEIKYRQKQRKCDFCSVPYPPDLLGEHRLVCPSKPKPISKPVIKPVMKEIEPVVFVPEQPIMDNVFFKQNELLPVAQIPRLTPLQHNAIVHMHKRSCNESNKVRAEMQKRVRRIGFNAKDLENLEFYIENYAPVIMHIHILRHMQFFLNDTHYRNQFETGKSSGSLSRSSRTQWEDRMFDKKYSGAKDFERVKYGVINLTNDPKGVNCATSYGPSYFLLKDHLRGRCTVTDKDSSSADARIGTFKFFLHILEKLNDRQIKSAFKASKAMEQSSSVSSTYKEIQIHGPIEFGKDIERLYVNKKEVQDKKFLDMVYEFSEKFKVPYQFFDSSK